MGGVINIITRKHSGAPKVSVTGEGGSYGTRDGKITASGSSGPLSISGTGTWFHTDGFSRVGNRDKGERDATDKWSRSTARDHRPGRQLEARPRSRQPEPRCGLRRVLDARCLRLLGREPHLNTYGRFTLDTPDFGLTNTFTVFRTDTTRRYIENGPITDYRGTDTGAEYQGLFKLPVGSLIFGTRFEQEDASQRNPPAPTSFSTSRDLYAGYLLYQLPVGEQLNLSFAGRYDGEVNGTGFVTGRVTGVYELPDWGARIRSASAPAPSGRRAISFVEPGADVREEHRRRYRLGTDPARRARELLGYRLLQPLRQPDRLHRRVAGRQLSKRVARRDRRRRGRRFVSRSSRPC